MDKQQRAPADPLAVALPSASKGTAEKPITVEEALDVECFKCGRAGHYQIHCTFKQLCVLCCLEGHASPNCPM